MRIFGYEIRKASKAELSQVSSGTWGWPVQLSSRSKPMLLSTVYRCVDLISNTMAVLPLRIYELDADGFKREAREHPLWWLLNNQPNEQMDRFTFIKLLTSCCLLRGNAYAYVERRPDLYPEQLVFVPWDLTQIVWVTDRDGVRRKRYQVQYLRELVEPSDMLHVKNFSYDGIVGVSTISHAADTLGIATSNEESVLGFFESGNNATGVLTVEGQSRVTKEQKDEIYRRWGEHTGKPGGLQILEGNMRYQPISISPKDAQLLESRQFNVIDICRFFSVSPVKAFDLSKSSYSTIEATELDYLNDTALSWITRFEQALNACLLLPSERCRFVIEFDTSVLLRTDKAAQATYWREMFNIGAATPNEIRQKSNLGRIEGGDDAFVQVNVQPLRRASAVSDKTPVVD